MFDYKTAITTHKTRSPILLRDYQSFQRLYTEEDKIAFKSQQQNLTSQILEKTAEYQVLQCPSYAQSADLHSKEPAAHPDLLTRSTGDVATGNRVNPYHKCCCSLQYSFPPLIRNNRRKKILLLPRSTLNLPSTSRAVPMANTSISVKPSGRGCAVTILMVNMPRDLTSALCYSCGAAFSPDPSTSSSPRLLKGAAHVQTHAVII